MSIPRATYRVQLHRGFTFRDATAIVPYLARLGISHLYASPFLKARPGSTHGYDVVDHFSLNPEIGSEEDLDALLAALRGNGMGLMLDVVPNHMGVLKADNAWWLDVLEHGQASRYADFFDIDWAPESAELQGKVLLPILGEQYGDVLDRGDIALKLDAARGELTLWYYEHRLPVRPSTYPHVLVPGIDRLGRESAAGMAALREIAEGFAAVPVSATAPGVDDAAARSDALKAQLASLCQSDPAVTRYIEANVRTMNGLPGEPSSFDALHALVKGQAYRLAFWRVAADDINYRRFFDINDLAALRAERPEVFEATHRRILELVAQGHADCLRIDHPDGLLDPARYCERLQAAAAAATGRTGDARAIYLVLEKILADHERLAPTWPVHGTTGYRFMNVVNGLFVDTSARSRFDRLYAAFIEEPLDFDVVLRRSKTLIIVNSLASDLGRLTNALTAIAKRDRHTCDFTRNSIRRALVDIIACFPVYRTYATDGARSDEDRRYIDWAIALAKRQSPAAEHSVFDFVGAILRGDVHAADADVAGAITRFVERFQQVTAPVTAKGMEDTSFYIYNRLVSLNEVGGNPRTFGFTLQAFHGASQDRARTWPHTMLGTATHDSKRGEDVRTRIDVLSEMPAAWRLALRRWRQLNRRHRSTVEAALAPSRNDEYLLYQTLLGAWPLAPLDEASLDAFRERIQAYMLKAVREAKVHTSWVNPYAPYEQALSRFIDGLLGRLEGNRFIQDLEPLAQRLAHHGCVNSLAQTLVKLTSPGVPDFYQGTELWQLALVDPDNRRPVDYALRERLLDALADETDPRSLLASWRDGRVKLWLTARVLALRRERAAWFERAGYRPIAAHGAHATRLAAYTRDGEDGLLVTVVPRLWSPLVQDEFQWPLGDVWSDTRLHLPGNAAWRNVLTGERLSGEATGKATRVAMRDVLATFPVALIEPA